VIEGNQVENQTGTVSRTEHVFESLRFDLLESKIQPGERLKLVELADRFGISQTVVREALTRLAEQGLVVANPKKGFMVMPLSIDDLLDLTSVRLRLEPMTLRDSIEHGDLAWESGVVAAHHALERTPAISEDPQYASTWRQCHRAFHQALCAGADSPRLEALVTQLRDSAELYRIWSRTLGHDTGRDVAAEHRGIMDAALARDTELATRLLAEHIARTRDALLEVARGS
jgi:DNA-binding GntR family transcriptional regulator